MDLSDISRIGFALLAVLALLGLFSLAAKRFGFAGASIGRPGRRLQVVESAALDAKRRLVLVRRDGVEHLVLLGVTTETVLEGGIAASPETAAGSSKP